MLRGRSYGVLRMKKTDTKLRDAGMRSFSILLFLAGLTACSNFNNKVWIAGWQQTTPLIEARAGATAVVAQDVMVVIGGTNGRDFINSVEYALIHPDGTLGTWQSGPRLNEPRGFTEAVVRGGFIYVAGGGNGPHGHNLLRSVERAQILPDGKIGAWHKESEMLVTRRCAKLVVQGNRIYAFGGYAGVLLDTVESAEFLPDGRLSEWRMEPEIMTMPRYVNGVSKIGDVAFAVGGHDPKRGVGVTSVEWAQFNSAGGLQKWQLTRPLQAGRYGLSTLAHDKYLYALGGMSGAEYLDSIEKSSVDASGNLDSWSNTTALSQPRAMLNVVHHNDNIYVIGGTNRDGYLTSVEMAKFNQEGDIGYWGSVQQADIVQKKVAVNRSIQSLPNVGIAKEVIQTEAYTYLRVQKPDGSEEWVAGPRLNILVNSRVEYSRGIAMSNFFSRELQHSFPMVLFVGEVRAVVKNLMY
ncbi:MAG: hypothetical protein ABL860_10000 [Candidatus Nitrotoga sp.]